MKCDKCPLAGDCPGEKARRVCRLLDPEDPDFDPAYAEKIEGPGFLRRIQNFAGAMLKFLGSGMATVDDATRESRLAECRACEAYFRDGWCVHENCGCLLELKAKVASQECPIGRWGRVGMGGGGCGGCGKK